MTHPSLELDNAFNLCETCLDEHCPRRAPSVTLCGDALLVCDADSAETAELRLGVE